MLDAAAAGMGNFGGRGSQFTAFAAPMMHRAAGAIRDADRRERARLAAEAERNRVAQLQRTAAGRRQLAREAAERKRNQERNAAFLKALFSGGGGGATSAASSGSTYSRPTCGAETEAECFYHQNKNNAPPPTYDGPGLTAPPISDFYGVDHTPQ